MSFGFTESEVFTALDKRKLTTYWANTSSNSLVGKLIRESGLRNMGLRLRGRMC